MPELSNVIVTGEPEKLPPDYAALIDPKTELPAGVAFFEKRATLQDMLWTLVLGLGISAIGAINFLSPILSLLGIKIQLLNDLAFLGWVVGLVFLFAGGWLLWSLTQRWSMMRRQQNGEHVRLGVFLTPDAIFEANEFGYCLVPRAHFRGLAGSAVKYLLNEKEKSYNLPEVLVGSDLSKLKAAIDQWAKA